MFITFESDAYENITYFKDVATQLLFLMGNSGTVPGALKAEEIPEALSKLQNGLAMEKRTQPSPPKDDSDYEPDISLVKRAIPLVHMLEAAIKKNCDVLWDSSSSI